MMTGSRMTRILFVVFVGLLGVVYLLNTRQQEQTKITAPTPLPEVFSGIEPTAITMIDVEAVKSKRRYKFVRTPGDWVGRDETGASVSVDLGQMARMIQVLSTLRYNRVMEASDVSTFGLADGGYFAVRFETGSASYMLHIGDLNSARTFAYVQRGQDPAVLQVPADQIVTLLLMFSDNVGVNPATQ